MLRIPIVALYDVTSIENRIENRVYTVGEVYTVISNDVKWFCEDHRSYHNQLCSYEAGKK